jgi:WXG100 family type VII secretion target
MLRVDPAAMNAATSDMAAAANSAAARLDQLEGYVKNLIDQGWQGDARNAYDIAKAKWDQAIAEMLQLLSQNAIAVNDANDAFMTTDKKNASLFNG